MYVLENNIGQNPFTFPKTLPEHGILDSPVLPSITAIPFF